MKLEIIWHFSLQFVLHFWIRRLQQVPRWKLHFSFSSLSFFSFHFYVQKIIWPSVSWVFGMKQNKLNFRLLFSVVSLANSRNNKWLLSLLRQWKLRRKNKTFYQKQRMYCSSILRLECYHKLTFRDTMAMWIIQTAFNRSFHWRKFGMVGGRCRSGWSWNSIEPCPWTLNTNESRSWMTGKHSFQRKTNVGCLIEWITRGTYLPLDWRATYVITQQRRVEFATCMRGICSFNCFCSLKGGLCESDSLTSYIWRIWKTIFIASVFFFSWCTLVIRLHSTT